MTTVSEGDPGWTPRLAAVQPVGRRTGRVLHLDGGVVVVVIRGHKVRTTYDPDMLSSVARDPQSAPRVGDRVRLRCWADGRTTVQRVLFRAVPDAR